MTGFLGLLKDNDEVKMFGSFLHLTAVLAVLDIAIRLDLLSIRFPSEILAIEISKVIVAILNIAPFVAMVLLLVLDNHKKEERQGNNLTLIILSRAYATFLFLYTLYNFLYACGFITVIKPMNGIFVQTVAVCFKLLRYVEIFALYVEDFYLYSVLSPFRVTYNTYVFQFNSPLTREQMNSVRAVVKKLFTDKTDYVYRRIGEDGIEKLKKYQYIEYFADGFLIGVNDERCSVDYLDKFAQAVNRNLLLACYEYEVILSKEKYTLAPSLKDCFNDEIVVMRVKGH